MQTFLPCNWHYTILKTSYWCQNQSHCNSFCPQRPRLIWAIIICVCDLTAVLGEMPGQRFNVIVVLLEINKKPWNKHHEIHFWFEQHVLHVSCYHTYTNTVFTVSLYTTTTKMEKQQRMITWEKNPLFYLDMVAW